MGVHDTYGKNVLKHAAPNFSDCGPDRFVPYGDCGGATVDGVVGTSIAVEIESRVSKQVRGAVLDLICHQYPKKLLVLLPVHMDNPRLCQLQCESLFSRFLSRSTYRVLLLTGSGHAPALEMDIEQARSAIADLASG